MEQEMTRFFNKEFGEIRTLATESGIWFVGKDIALALGYGNTKDALARHVDPEDRGGSQIPTPSGTQDMTIINESGLYSLILSSKLPGAKRFKRWVTNEVLPSINRNGGYINGQETMSESDLMAKALLVAQRQIENRDKQISEMAPKALFADAVSTSHNSILVGELAKILKQNGVEIGQNRLFDWMRTNGYLIRRQGSDYNMPTQRAMEMGLFEIKENAVTHSDGHVTISKTPKITGTGQVFFTNKFLNSKS